MSSLELYLKNSVKYNKAYNELNDDFDTTGKICFDLSKTMIFLFTDDQIKYDEKTSECNTSFVLYDLQNEKGENKHTVILFHRVLYEMIDGWLYRNKLIITDEFIEHHSSELYKTQLKIVKKTYFNVKPENESKRLLKLLDE